MNVSQGTDKKQFYQPAVDTISLILGLPACIWLADEARSVLKIVAATGLSDEYIRKASLCLDEPSVASKVLEIGKTIVVPDIASDDRWQYRSDAAAMRLKSAIVVPLRVEEKIVGVLDVYTHEVRDFSDFEKVLIEKLAAQMVTSAIRNTHFFEQATNRAEALQKLHQIGGQILSAEFSAQGLEKVLRQVAQSAKDVLDADLVDVYRYVEAENRWILPPVLEGKRLGPEVVKDEIFEDDVVVKVVEDSKPIYTANVQSVSLLTGEFTVKRPQRPEKRFVVREGILSSAAVPLMAAGETVGVMFVNYRTQQDFTPDQREAIELFANQAATAIYNARVYEQDQKRIKALEAINEVGQQLNTIEVTEEGLQRLLQQVAQQAKEVMVADLVELYQYSLGRGNIVTAHVCAGERLLDIEPAEKVLPDDVVAKVLIERNPLFVSDALSSPLLAGHFETNRKGRPEQRFVVREQIASTAAIPLTVGDEAVGVLFVNYRTSQKFHSEQQELIQLFANQAAVAIRTAQLHERLQVVNKVGQALTKGIRLREDEILKLIRDQAGTLMDTDNMYIALYDGATDTVRFGLAFKEKKPIKVATRKAGKGRTEEIIRTKKPIFTATEAEAEVWYAQPGHEEYIGDSLASWLGVPMMVSGKVLGVIATYHPTRDHVYSEDDLAILQVLANQAAIALENARLYEEARNEVIVTKQLATLGTVMAALQHRINNTFNIIVPNVTRLRKRVDMTDATIVEILDIIERNARYTSDIIKRIQDPLRASEVQEVNINAVLNDVVGELRELRRADSTQALILPTVNLDESIPNIQASSAQIAEVFRNLANNACRAMKEGGQLTIASQLDDGKICVRVQDTGPGIPPRIQQRLFNQPVPSKEPGGGAGLGLWLSRLMLQSIGGDVTIAETSSAGTTMLVQIPTPEAGKERGI